MKESFFLVRREMIQKTKHKSHKSISRKGFKRNEKKEKR